MKLIMDSKLYAVEKNTRSIGIKNKLSQTAEEKSEVRYEPPNWSE